MWDDIIYDANSYCCEHFLIDAYNHYTTINLTEKLLKGGFFNVQNLRNFKPVDTPSQYSIVLFRAKNQAHVGLWLDGRVLHLEPHGVVWQLLDVVKKGFDRVVFYELN